MLRMRSLLCLMIFLFLLTSSVAFVNSRTNHGKSFQQKLKLRNSHENQVFDPMRYSFKDNDKFSKEILALGILLMPCSDALAKDGAYGIFEGRSASMLHPVTMFALFATSLYSASLGLKWRQLRYIGEEIKTKSSELPNLSSGKAKFPISEQVSSIQTQLSSLKTSAQVDSNAVSLLEKDLSLLNNAKELDSTIAELSKTRKELQGANLRDKHWISGSTVLGVGVGVSILGGFNTYMRAGKLFPGPHLYAGMAITGLWAASAALVPAMQKGNESARTAHIVLNSITILLFGWQVLTGFDIAVKVWGFTHWP